MSREIRDFFNREAAGYGRRPGGMRPFHEITDEKLGAALSGAVLCVGSLWVGSSPLPSGATITAADSAIAMLLRGERSPDRSLGADALGLPFRDDTFDHLVYPLVLHHIAETSAARSRALVRRALAEGKRVLRPGGTLWISDFSVPRPVYVAERFLAPVTRLLLRCVRQPFLVMHTAGFYARTLESLGFSGVAAERIRPTSIGPWDTMVPVIAAPWFHVPRFAYPLYPTLIAGTK